MLSGPSRCLSAKCIGALYARAAAAATGTRTVFVAGQVAGEADGVLVGEGDLAAQVEQCYADIATAPAAPEYLVEIDATAVLA